MDWYSGALWSEGHMEVSRSSPEVEKGERKESVEKTGQMCLSCECMKSMNGCSSEAARTMKECGFGSSCCLDAMCCLSVSMQKS